MPKSTATLQKELGDYEHIRDNYGYYELHRLLPNKWKPETKSQIEAMIAKTKAELTKRNDVVEIAAPSNAAKKEQEANEARTAALASRSPFGDDILRKIHGNLGGKKRKTRKGKSRKTRKTRRA